MTEVHSKLRSPFHMRFQIAIEYDNIILSDNETRRKKMNNEADKKIKTDKFPIEFFPLYDENHVLFLKNSHKERRIRKRTRKY